MKFNDGYWLLREGVTARYATECVDVRCDERSVSIAALTKPWQHRGSHLNTPTIEVDVFSPAPDVLGVRLSHRVAMHSPLTFEICDEAPPVEIERTDDSIRFRSGGLEACMAVSGPWAMEFRTDGSDLTSARSKSTASMSTDDGEFMMQRLELPIGANVYGLGERFTPFVKNGQVVDSWNQDGGSASDQAYKAIPFLLTDAGFGVFVNHPGRVSFEIASEVVSAIQFSAPGDQLEYYVVYGPTPSDILRKYTALTGRPALPPQWSFGLWLTTSFTTSYDEQTVNEFIDGMADRDIPLSVFHLDCYWMRPLQWCDFEWDVDAFPDPEGMLERLAARGLRISAWINPYIGERSPLFAEAAERGFLVRRPDGSVWQWDMWVAGMGIVDFTNPEARAWYGDKVRKLLRQGVHAIKADFGERIPTDVVWHDGADPERMHNLYSLLYNRTVFEAIEAEHGTGEAVLFARSATAGAQQFPVHWGGDCESTFAAMYESLRGGLSLGLSGFGFWSHDIGGFEGTPTPELFKRWLVFGLLSSHARLHGSDSYRVPWAFDDEAVDIARIFTHLRNRLMPTIWNAAIESHTDGIPVMRPMMLAFPDDPTCAPLDRQYMLGPDLLVAPVFDAAGAVEFYAPVGRWRRYREGDLVEGPAWRREQHANDSVPLLARAGSIIVATPHTARPDTDHALAPIFEVFELDDGATAHAVIHDERGRPKVRLRCSRRGEELSAEIVHGADQLAAGWTLTWVTGPLGPDRGPSVSCDVGARSARLRID